MVITVDLSKEEAQLIKDAIGVAVRKHVFVLPDTLRMVDTIMVKINLALGDAALSNK